MKLPHININIELVKITCVYVTWIIIHYVATHLYARLCTPLTLYGFIISPFITAIPYCQGLRWAIYNCGLTISNMWVLLGAWISTNIFANLIKL